MKRAFAKSLSAASSLSLILLVNGIAAQAQRRAAPPPITSETVASPAPTGSAFSTAAREWTREEMLSAIPLDIAPNAPFTPSAGGLVPKPTGARGGTAPGQGGAASNGVPRISADVEQLGREMASGEAAAYEMEPNVAAFAYPYPFTRYAAFTSDYTTFPYRAVGKVFFRQNGLSYVCSASSIGNYSVITAGHCVHRGNNSTTGWSTNFVFVPGYRSGIAPYGQFAANHLRVMTLWYQLGSTGNGFSRDVGGAVLNKNTIGASTLKVSQRVGWLGTLWNASYFQHFHSLGYPAAPPFNGLSLQICSSSFARHDPAYTPNTFAIGCDATQGTSGGPVVVGLRAVTGFTNRVNGVNSYKYTIPAQPLALYSPYFDTSIGGLINCLINSGPGVQRCAPPAAP